MSEDVVFPRVADRTCPCGYRGVVTLVLSPPGWWCDTCLQMPSRAAALNPDLGGAG